MTNGERAEQREHWIREIALLKWLVGMVVSIIVGGAVFVWQAGQWVNDVGAKFQAQNVRLEQSERRYISDRERFARIEAVQQADAQALTRLDERIQSLQDGFTRIERSINELTRHLRGPVQ